MNQQFTKWLQQTKLRDPIEQGQARVLQLMLVLFALFGAVLFSSSLLMFPSQRLAVLPEVIAGSLLLCSPIIALVILRRGLFETAVLIMAVGFVLANSVVLISFGIEMGVVVMMLYLLPLTLSGLLARRRVLILIVALIVGIIALVALLEGSGSPLIGFALPPGGNEPPLAVPFCVLIILITILFLIFGQAFRQALQAANAREQALEELRASLETTVQNRTSELRSALGEVETRANAQAALLAENELQRETIREMNVPVLPVDAATLVIPLVGLLDDRRLEDVRERVLFALEQRAVRHILLDVTGVPVLDSHVAAGLIAVAQAARLMGAETMLIGIRPEVAQSLVGLGIDLQGIRSASDLQNALADLSHSALSLASTPSAR